MAWPCVAASGSASVIFINHLTADCSRWMNYGAYRSFLNNPVKCLKLVHLLSPYLSYLTLKKSLN